MVKQTIRIFCRIKPTQQQTGLYEVEQEEHDNPKLSFNVPRGLADGFVNNKKEVYNFKFDRIFDQKTQQDEIFSVVAKPTIDSVLSGYNGTMFAYGQTGSGKTFTITGGAERYVDRGVIPRMLSYVFEQYDKAPSHVFTTHISYLEIYNEYGYDLLDPKHEASKLEDLPKVSLLEDNDGNIHLRNLSLHSASNEEDALNLLFLGDTNRMIAETPMNQASTRSHCIFTVHITARETGSATIRRSKLHLVDLAGSERVGKTGVGGVLLTEAKYINLSLHFLEQVIIALSEKSRSHIPYRNSMMTSVLRDSLGGNCMTSMIATCSVEKKNIDESISTCRFAQRVALIKNDALLNEEMDPKLMIIKLKREIQELKDELALTTGQTYEGELDDQEKERLRSLVKAFVIDKDPEAVLQVGADMRKINFCFYVLKEFASSRPIHSADSTISVNSQISTISADEDTSYLADKNELQKLKDLIKQRDNEINILVSMLKKEKQNVREAENRRVSLQQHRSDSVRSHGETSAKPSKTEMDSESRKDTQSQDEFEMRPKSGRKTRNALLEGLNKKQAGMSAGRQEAFETFRRDYEDNAIIEKNKRLLKEKYAEAKGLGEQVNKSRQMINSLKGKLEQNRMKRSIQENVTGSVEDCAPLDEEEGRLRKALDQEKAGYKDSFNALKNLKTEIEHLQHLLEKSKVKLQKDFEFWWAEQSNKVAEERNEMQNVKAAWRTPPLSPAELENLSRIPANGELRVKQKDRHQIARASVTSHSSEDVARPRPRSLAGDNIMGSVRGSRDTEASMRSTGSIAAKLRSEVNSLSDVRSSRSSMASTDSHNSRKMQERWKSADSAVSQGSVGSQQFQLTGDSQADADILAFMKARQTLLKQKNSSKR